MFRNYKNVLLGVVLSAVAAVAVNVLLAARSSSETETIAPNKQGAPQPANNRARSRNLSLQPEAFNLSRRLGRRFSTNKPQESTVIGNLKIGTEESQATVIRKVRDDGEQVEIQAPNLGRTLGWNSLRGAFAADAPATGNVRDLIERIVLDSPDQFVLAQLRGASYQTIARNVRPAGVSDDYAGPLWTVVRVDESAPDKEKKTRTNWRLYYLNSKTGLLDKIVSQGEAGQIETQLSGWTDFAGEKVATQITWSSNERVIMQYRIIQFSNAEK